MSNIIIMPYSVDNYYFQLLKDKFEYNPTKKVSSPLIKMA